MANKALLIFLDAKPGREEALADFLKGLREIAQQEPGTISWHAFRSNDSKFGIFVTFLGSTEQGTHFASSVASALKVGAEDFLASTPMFEALQILASKAST